MQEADSLPAFLKSTIGCITILYIYYGATEKNVEKGLEIQVSTLFDTIKLDFYPVEKVVETVNNYWMTKKLPLLWKPYS